MKLTLTMNTTDQQNTTDATADCKTDVLIVRQYASMH